MVDTLISRQRQVVGWDTGTDFPLPYGVLGTQSRLSTFDSDTTDIVANREVADKIVVVASHPGQLGYNILVGRLASRSETTRIFVSFHTGSIDSQNSESDLADDKVESRLIQALKSAKHLDRIGKRERILASLTSIGYSSVADRIRYLQELASGDPEEIPILGESLRRLYEFLSTEKRLVDPSIGVSPVGNAVAEWRIPSNDHLALEFLSNGSVKYAAIATPQDGDAERKCLYGTYCHDRDSIPSIVRDCLVRLAVQ